MFIVALVSQKGGAGKTTLGLALAVHAERSGLPTVVLDLDQQASACVWKDWRQDVPPEVFAAQAPRLATILASVAKQGANLVVLDTPPQANQIAEAAMQVADVVLMPCRPTALDLQSVTTTARLAAQMGRPAFAVLNATRARSPLTEDAARALTEAKIQLCPIRMGDRADHQTPLASGRVASEWNPSGKASMEVAALWDWLRAMSPDSKPAIRSPRRRASKEG